MIDTIYHLKTKNEEFPMAFSIGIWSKLQKEFGSINKLETLATIKGENGVVEPNLEIIIRIITDMINEGIDIENEKAAEKREFISTKKAGRIITEVGVQKAFNKMMQLINESQPKVEPEKNVQTTRKQMPTKIS